MGLRSAPGTILRFVAAVTGLYFVLAPGLLLLVVVVRTVGGHYPIPSDQSIEALSDLSLLLSVLLGAWFVVEEYSLKRLFAFAVSVWMLFWLPAAVVAAVGSRLGPLPFGSFWGGVVVFVVGVSAYIGGYRLIYPAKFAERTKKFDFGT